MKRSAGALGDILQDVKDELHHNGPVTPLAPPAVNDRDQRAVKGVQVLSWEGLPIAAGHKSNLKMNQEHTYWSFINKYFAFHELSSLSLDGFGPFDLIVSFVGAVTMTATYLTSWGSKVTRSPSLAIPSSFSSLRCGHSAKQNARAMRSVKRLCSADADTPT